MAENGIIPGERIMSKIYIIRGKKVMFDKDLADLYGVRTKSLNLSVKRNMRRFPEDFMFKLSKEEFKNLRSQFETSSWGGTRVEPNAFTEQGVAMLSSVLKSDRAILVNIHIIRIFTKIRELLVTNEALKQKILEIEMKYDGSIREIFKTLETLLPEEKSIKRNIGFK